MAFKSVPAHVPAQARIMWKWGPVTQYSIDLAALDSAGEGCGNVMELIANRNACRPTQEMLLDSFMTGFINKLYLLKWHLFGWKVRSRQDDLLAISSRSLRDLARMISSRSHRDLLATSSRSPQDHLPRMISSRSHDLLATSSRSPPHLRFTTCAASSTSPSS